MYIDSNKDIHTKRKYISSVHALFLSSEAYSIDFSIDLITLLISERLAKRKWEQI